MKRLLLSGEAVFYITFQEKSEPEQKSYFYLNPFFFCFRKVKSPAAWCWRTAESS